MASTSGNTNTNKPIYSWGKDKKLPEFRASVNKNTQTLVTIHHSPL
jgi:hypothetical protein